VHLYRCVIGRTGRKRNAELCRRRGGDCFIRDACRQRRWRGFNSRMTHVRVHARTDLWPRVSASTDAARLINLPFYRLRPRPGSRISSKAEKQKAAISIRADRRLSASDRLSRIIRDGETRPSRRHRDTPSAALCLYARACVRVCVCHWLSTCGYSLAPSARKHYTLSTLMLGLMFYSGARARDRARPREKC